MSTTTDSGQTSRNTPMSIRSILTGVTVRRSRVSILGRGRSDMILLRVSERFRNNFLSRDLTSNSCNGRSSKVTRQTMWWRKSNKEREGQGGRMSFLCCLPTTAHPPLTSRGRVARRLSDQTRGPGLLKMVVNLLYVVNGVGALVMD